MIEAALLNAFNRQRQVEVAARLVARHHRIISFAGNADRHPLRMPRCAKTPASTPNSCWKPESGRSPYGATAVGVQSDVSEGRRPRLRGPLREGPESGRKRSLRSRQMGFAAHGCARSFRAVMQEPRKPNRMPCPANSSPSQGETFMDEG
jgi:hypothetical protein